MRPLLAGQTPPGELEQEALFAVFDGHGSDGHLCAWFVRDNVSIHRHRFEQESTILIKLNYLVLIVALIDRSYLPQ